MVKKHRIEPNANPTPLRRNTSEIIFLRIWLLLKPIALYIENSYSRFSYTAEKAEFIVTASTIATGITAAPHQQLATKIGMIAPIENNEQHKDLKVVFASRIMQQEHNVIIIPNQLIPK